MGKATKLSVATLAIMNVTAVVSDGSYWASCNPLHHAAAEQI